MEIPSQIALKIQDSPYIHQVFTFKVGAVSIWHLKIRRCFHLKENFKNGSSAIFVQQQHIIKRFAESPIYISV